MGSDLYKVKVAAKQDRTVTLRVEVVHPDSNYLSNNESFALMVLHEGTRDAKDSLLAKEISFEDTLDRGWLTLYTRGFIESSVSKIESGSAEGQTQADWIKGSLTITVTDAAWVSHLAVGTEFDSRAFDVAWEFEPCAPIRPGQVDPNAPMPEAFIAMPGSLWQDSGLPQVVRAAAYSSSAYRAKGELRKGTFTPEQLKDLDGHVVVFQGQYDSSLQVGLLHILEGSIRVFTVGDGGHGSSSSTPWEGTIALAELVPGKRLGSRLKLSSKLGNMEPRLDGATVEGDSATFRISVPPGNSTYAEVNDDQLLGLGFQLLVAPLFPKERGAQSLLNPSPLSWTIEREVLQRFPAEERQVTQYINNQSIPVGDSIPEQSGLARKLARGFIAKTEITSKAEGSSGALDSLTEAQQREVLAKPWAQMTVKVTPHHAVYLQHLSAPFEAVTVSYAQEAEAWDGAPAVPATASAGFGKKTSPPPQASSPSPSAPSSPQSAGPNKVLKYVGIGCGVLIALFLLCLITGAIMGGGKG